MSKYVVACVTAGELYACDVQVTKSRALAEVVRMWMLRQYGWKPNTSVGIREAPDDEEVSIYDGHGGWKPAPEWK